jgi:hypothetical protein
MIVILCFAVPAALFVVIAAGLLLRARFGEKTPQLIRQTGSPADEAAENLDRWVAHYRHFHHG